jgi:cytoskeletal protein CcmA (bactofilin family)
MNTFNQHPDDGRHHHDSVHYDEITCLQYLEGLLDRPKALELSAHTTHCPDCRALLGALERETRMLSSALREQEEALPARLLAGPERDRTPWAWVGVFGLAAAGAYWLWTTIIDPWSDQLSQAGFGGTNLMTMLFFNGAFWKGWDSMWSTIQAFALISLTVIGFFLLRRSLRRWNTIAMVMGALLAALGLPFGVHAAEIHKHEPSYTLPADAVVKNDLIVFANTTRIDGTVDGDVIVSGQSATINGHVRGDVIFFGSTLQINGIVDGNVRGFCGQVALHGKIGKNLTAFVGTLDADSKSEIGWSATFYGGDMSLNGRIERDVFGGAGRLDVNGFVGGNMDIKANDAFTIGQEAQLQGKIEYTGNNQAVVSSGARLASPIDFKYEPHSVDWYTWTSFAHKAETWGAAFIFGLLLLFVAPGFFAETVHNSNRFGPSLGIGAILFIATPIVAVLVCFTIVGLAVGISTFLLYVIASYGSKMFVATWLGQKISPKAFAGVISGEKRWPSATKGAMIGQLALGLLIIYALRMIPYIGIGTALLAEVWGFGAMSLTLYRRMHPVTAELAPASA